MSLSRIKLLTRKILTKRSQQLNQQNQSLQTGDKPFFKNLVTIGTKTNRNIRIDSNSIRQNKRLLQSIYSTVNSIKHTLKNEMNVNKTDKVGNPLDIFKKKDGNDGGILGGLLGALGLGASIIGKVFNILARPIVSVIVGITKWIGKLALRLGITGARWLKKGADFILDKLFSKNNPRNKTGKWRFLSKAGDFLKRNSAKAIRFAKPIASRIGMRIVAKLGITALSGPFAPVVGIALLASEVGMIAYDLAKYFKLGEKLDDLINKFTGGKYRDLADIFMGITHGNLASDIGTWLKDKALSFFNTGYNYIKSKVIGLLEKLNPFSGGKAAEAANLAKTRGNQSELTNAINSIESKEEDDNVATVSDISASSETSKPSFFSNIANTASNMASAVSNAASNAYDTAVSATTDAIEGAANVLNSAKETATDAVNGVINSVSNFFNGNNPVKNPLSGTPLSFYPTELTRVSSPFGMRKDPQDGQLRQHNGVDIAVAEGSTVFAAADGEVVNVTGDSGRGGRIIEIKHAAGMSTIYGHLSRQDVKVGDRVKGGQAIALSGKTMGGVYPGMGAHLHFEVRQNGKAINPQEVLPFTGYIRGFDSKGDPVGGPNIVNGVAESFDSLTSASNVNRYSEISNEINRAVASPRMHIKESTANSNTATIETTTGDVISPRIISTAIAMATNSVYYT